MGRLLFLPLGGPDPGLAGEILEGLFRASPIPPALFEAPLDPEPAFDPERRQYSCIRLLELLGSVEITGNDDRILGFLDRDLFLPVLTFVFGAGMLEGPAAVFSTARLCPTYYGLPESRELLVARGVKEALHEVGHTFGLHHCSDIDCVMHASTSAGEIDLKPALYCPACRCAFPEKTGR